MNNYESKKQARIERLRSRAEKKRAFADANGLDLYGEARSGIPMGQPILVGHHSEGRHRKHLERIENKVRKGFEASKEAERLDNAADAAESRKAIDSDNPDAENLLAEKLSKLIAHRDRLKKLNQAVRACKGNAEFLTTDICLIYPDLNVTNAMSNANDLLTPDFAGRIGIPAYRLTNLGAEIRRLEKRLKSVAVIQSGFEPFQVGEIKVELVDGQVQVEFPWKPNDATRDKLKRAPLTLKWSSYSKRWVRKHTESTAGQYFMQELKAALESAAP